jgi:acyl-CoA thioesterase|nr:thioesterase family protein [Kofleriaceae bacterium]
MSSPDSPIDVLCTPDFTAPSRARIAIPATWDQGRGLFGGLVTGILTRALESSAPDRPLRSLTAEICGPVQPGEALLELEVLRAGNAVTTTAIRLVQSGEVQAHGVGVLGTARGAGTDRVDLVPPPRTRWQDAPVLGMPAQLQPGFAKHLEFRMTGPLPFSSGPAGVVEGWMRFAHPGERRDAAYLAACIDSFWPALYTTLAAPRPMATIAFTFQPFLRADRPLGDEPLRYRARLAAAHDGYCVEMRELWHADGYLVALNQQTMVVIK